MKILRVIPGTDRQNGGPIEGAIQITRVLASQGHHTEVVSVEAPNQPWMVDLPFEVHGLGPPKSGYYYCPALVSWLKSNARRFDAVVVHGLWQYHSLAAWKALRGGNTPYVVYPHGMLDPYFNRAFPLKHLKKALYWPWAEYRVLRDAHSVCFTCEEERILARQSFWPYRCNEEVVNYGTSFPPENASESREEFLRKYPELAAKRLILYLSRIHPKKGCDLLLDSFAKAAAGDSSLHLVMAGPETLAGYRSQLERQAARLKIDHRVTWAGMLTGSLKWGAFNAAEVFILPSHQENFGIAVAESLACGVPVLISDRVNIWREIEADGAGIIANDTADGTDSLLSKWGNLDASRRDAMRKAARECFQSRFEIGKAASSLIRVLDAATSSASAH